MDFKKFFSKRQNQLILGGLAILGIGYYLYKQGKLPFLQNKLGGTKLGGTKKAISDRPIHKMGYLTQGRIEGKDEPNAVAVHFANPRPKESEVAPNGINVTTKDFVYIKGTDFDGKYKLGAKWTDKNGNLGAVWIGVKKKLGAQYPENIYAYEGKGTIQIDNK